jgi:hypothetical protein
MPHVIQQLMRHADIQSTMRFYVDLKAHDLGQVIDAAASEKPSRAQTQKGRKPKTRRKPTQTKKHLTRIGLGEQLGEQVLNLVRIGINSPRNKKSHKSPIFMDLWGVRIRGVEPPRPCGH